MFHLETGLGAIALPISTLCPSWFLPLGFSAKAGGFIYAFLGLALPAPPLGSLGICGQGFGCSGAYECASTWRTEGRRVNRWRGPGRFSASPSLLP